MNFKYTPFCKRVESSAKKRAICTVMFLIRAGCLNQFLSPNLTKRLTATENKSKSGKKIKIN